MESGMVDRLLGREEKDRDGAAQQKGGRGGRDAGAEPPDPKAAVWRRVQLARNLARPRTLELLDAMADEVIELHGDREFGDDAAMVAGFARIDGRRIAFVGQQKGADTDENIRRNFGMPHPEGYRKAMRIMELAERFGLPIVTFVDVPGAHPGPESEERGIAEAIARSIGLMSRLRTPIVAIITGEGGSGGALAIAVGDVVIALENAVYSVISPEGCASILWRTADEAPTAALAMRMSAQDQLELGVVDRVVPEPGDGAHADPRETARRLRTVIIGELDRLAALTPDELVEARYRRYRSLGPYTEVATPEVAPPPSRGIADRLRDLLDPTRWSMGMPLPGSSRRDEPPAHEEV
jgi:acetyl-CoA carboxylase carboxyl transferase subunit alpha